MPSLVNESKDEERDRLLPNDVGTSYDSLLARPKPPRGSTYIEPVVILFLFAQSLSDTVVTNLLEYQTCKTQLRLPDENCTDPISADIEDMVQPSTAKAIMARNLIEAFIPSLLALLIGPWSDANGRKPFLIISLAGMTLSYVWWGVLSLTPGIHPYYMPLASIPLSLTGGSCSIYLLSICYVSDVTDEHTRPFRFAVLNLALSVSGVFGLICAPLVVKMQHSPNPYPLVFFISATIMMTATIYTCLGIQEMVVIRPGREKRFFLFGHIKRLGSTCFEPREGRARIMILLIAATLTIHSSINYGESAVMYLATREMFAWNLTDYTRFNAFASIFCGTGGLAGVWFLSTLLKVPNMIATSLVLLDRLARSLIMAFSKRGLDFYLAVIVSPVYPAYAPLCRTELSRLVPVQDLGKVFALVSLLESMAPVVAAPAYTYVYGNTFLKFPSAIYWLSASICTISIVMIIFVAVLRWRVKGACYPDTANEPR